MAHSLLGGSTKLLDISVTHWRCGTVALFEPWVDFGQIRAQQLLAERDNTTDFFYPFRSTVVSEVIKR